MYKEGTEALSLTPLDSLNSIGALRNHKNTESSAVPLLLAADLAFKKGLQMLLTAAQRPGSELARPDPEQQGRSKVSMESFWLKAREYTKEGEACMQALYCPAMLRTQAPMQGVSIDKHACMHAGMERFNSLLCAAAFAELCFMMEGPACATRLTELHQRVKGGGHWRDPAEDVLDAAEDNPAPWQHVRRPAHVSISTTLTEIPLFDGQC